ncbi:MAG: hypothetical protein ACI9MR_001993 [Myxococcota bacterium]|jgi:hypothetical protein
MHYNLFVATVVAALACAGCQRDLGIEEQRFECESGDECLPGSGCVGPEAASSVDDTAGLSTCQDCQEAPWPTECGTCMTANCCAESQACADETACTNERSCVVACEGVKSCEDVCVTAVTVGAYDAQVDYRQCRNLHCAEACGRRCGDLPMPIRGTAPGCGECLDANCCDVMSVCGDDPSCLHLLECFRASPAYDHTLACLWDMPASEAVKATVVVACGTNNCRSACNGGQDWSCIDRFVVPVAATDTVSWTFIVLEQGPNTPVAGLNVRACEGGDLLCEQPIDTQTTDAAGRVTFDLPTVYNGFPGFLEIRDPAEDHYPLRYEISPNPTADGILRNVYVLSHQSIANLQIFSTLVGGPVIDMTKAFIAIEIHDCFDLPAAGINVQLDASDETGTRLYAADGGFDFDAEATDKTGVLAFVNVAQGPGTLTASVADSGQTVSTQRVFMRDGWITQLRIVPLPREQP